MRELMLVAVLAGLVGVGGCDKAASGVAPDAKFRPVIPEDTKVLADIQVDRLKTTPFYQRHQKELNLPMLETSSERLGLDPVRDVSELLIAWNGKRALVLADGRFKPAEIQQKLTAMGAPQTSYKQYQLFGDGKNSLVFLKNDLAVEGTVVDVQKAIDLASNGKETIPEELQQTLRQVPKRDQVWLVSRGGLPFVDAPMRSDIQSALSNIVNFITGATAGLQLDSGAHIQMEITCISEQGAQRVHDALRGGIGLARLSTKDDQQELLRVYDAINVNQDKTVVRVNADYSAQLADELIARLEQGRRAIQR